MEVLKKLFGRQLGASYKKGTVLYSAGDRPEHIYTVLSGQVDLYSKTWIKVASLTKGDYVGIAYLFGCTKREFTAIVGEDTRLLQLERKVLIEKVHRDPSLAYKLMTDMSARYHEIIKKLT